MSLMTYGRNYGKQWFTKNTNYLHPKDPGDELILNENKKDFEHFEHSNYGGNLIDALDGSVIEVESLAAMNSRTHEGSSEPDNSGSNAPSQTELSSKVTRIVKNGGIFDYLSRPVLGDVEHNLLAALKCYEKARKTLLKLPSGLSELESLVKKKGWVCNELGTIIIENKELIKAELAFVDAIDAFREVSDHTNIILINCNLGHGQRTLAEEMVSKIENLKLQNILHNAYTHALETAKLEYKVSIRYYGAARLELNTVNEDDDVYLAIHSSYSN
ncbi:hypothetical protein HN51_061791 [Arachis hypogaea]